MTYNIINFYFTILLCDGAIGQHCTIKNGPLYRVSYLYAALLLSMKLSPDFKPLSLTLVVMVSSFTIFVYYILINLCMILLTY